jgi:hypothetical protein
MTDELIDALSHDLAPRPGRRVGARLGSAIVAGGVATLVGVTLLLGLRPDMPAAAVSPMFWMKLAYPLAVAIVATACLERLVRPAGEPGRRVPWLAAPLLVMAVAAMAQLGMARPAVRGALVMGGSAMICPWLILACAAPLVAALVWAVRGLAPTRLREAGASVGLTAGAFGATIYALHCAEPGAAFVLLWYSLGMVVPAGAGALAGPALLRWR